MTPPSTPIDAHDAVARRPRIATPLNLLIVLASVFVAVVWLITLQRIAFEREQALAAEMATKGVTVNAISPGYVGTEMVMSIRDDIRQSIIDSVPMKRLGKPEEIGAAVSYLASELAGYVTGATLNINGGLYYQ